MLKDRKDRQLRDGRFQMRPSKMMLERRSPSSSSEDKPKSSYSLDFSFEESAHLIIEFNKDSYRDIIVNLWKKLQEQGFKVRKQGTRFYLRGEEERLLLAAEVMKLKKKNKDGKWVNFSIKNFTTKETTSQQLSKLLTHSEKIRVCQHILEENLLIDKTMKIPGLGKVYPAQSYIAVCQERGVINKIFPLHEEARLNALRESWFMSSITGGIYPLPRDSIKDYFGESIAYYFCFLTSWTQALVPVVLLSFLFALLEIPLEFYGIIVSLFMLYFNEIWTITSNNLAFRWGTYLHEEDEQPRGTYHNDEKPIEDWSSSRKLKPVPDYGKTRGELFKSWTFIFVTLAIICVIKTKFIEYQREHFDDTNIAVAYSVLLNFLCSLYRFVADSRTNAENHYTESSYEWHLVSKLIALDSVTLFFGPLYSLVTSEDREPLHNLISVQLTTSQIINTIKELFIPFLLNKWHQVKKTIVEEKIDSESPKIIEQSLKTSYNTSYDDYLELYIQYGYIVLFSGSYPKASLFALFNNVLLECLTDSYKLCSIHQRPLIKSATDIGVWEQAMALMSVMGIIVNVFFTNTFQHLELYAGITGIKERQWNLGLILVVFILSATTKAIPERSSDLENAMREEKQHKKKIVAAFARVRLKLGKERLEEIRKNEESTKKDSKKLLETGDDASKDGELQDKNLMKQTSNGLPEKDKETIEEGTSTSSSDVFSEDVDGGGWKEKDKWA